MLFNSSCLGVYNAPRQNINISSKKNKFLSNILDFCNIKKEGKGCSLYQGTVLGELRLLKV